jgi:putative transposase
MRFGRLRFGILIINLFGVMLRCDCSSFIAVARILRKHSISSATHYKRKSHYGGADMAELKRLKEHELENGRLKRMYSDFALENAAIKDVLSRKL